MIVIAAVVVTVGKVGGGNPAHRVVPLVLAVAIGSLAGYQQSSRLRWSDMHLYSIAPSWELRA